MKLTKQDGKTYLTGTVAEVGHALRRMSSKKVPIDLGWSLNKLADEASEINGERFVCDCCSFEGVESQFVGGGCPECGKKTISRA